jgi:cysteinyl-tRNA synthetase
LLRTHYRQPIDFTVRALEEAEKTLERWDSLAHAFEASPVGQPSMLPAQFFDDMNTPIAIASLHAVADNLGTLASKNDAKAIGEFLASIELLGINMSPEARRQRTKSSNNLVDQETLKILIEPKITDRLAARAAKNWKESDRIRDELAAMGIALKDNKDGTTTWEVKR